MMLMDVVESRTGVIEIKDFSLDTIESFVEFLYLGKTEKMDTLADDLFAFGDKYQIESMKASYFSN